MAHHTSPYKADRAPWTPPADEVEVQAAGVAWDAVRIPLGHGERVLALMADTTGCVIDDAHHLYFLIEPHAADGWDDIAGVVVLGSACYVVVPPGWRRDYRSNLYWRIPPTRYGYLTDADALLDAVVVAARAGRER